jgi:hypothetical protein
MTARGAHLTLNARFRLCRRSFESALTTPLNCSLSSASFTSRSLTRDAHRISFTSNKPFLTLNAPSLNPLEPVFPFPHVSSSFLSSTMALLTTSLAHSTLQLPRLMFETHPGKCLWQFPTSARHHDSIICPKLTQMYRFSYLQRQVYHRGDNRRRMRIVKAPVFEPLENDQKVHVTKDKHQKDQLRQKLKPELNFPLKIKRIGRLNQDSQSHMHNSNNYRYFHLETINVVKVVFCNSPHRINAKRIHTVMLSLNMLSLFGIFHIKTRPEQV